MASLRENALFADVRRGGSKGTHLVQSHPLGEGRVLQKSLYRTGPADISLVGHNAVAAMSTNNHLPAFRTLRRLIARWVVELLEIVLIGGHIHIVLGVEAFTARCAGLPGTRMTLMRVIVGKWREYATIFEPKRGKSARMLGIEH